jgi:hypothetical protein
MTPPPEAGMDQKTRCLADVEHLMDIGTSWPGPL